jgi:hypothetical protein
MWIKQWYICFMYIYCFLLALQAYCEVHYLPFSWYSTTKKQITSDTCYTLLCYPHWSISTVLFQYHEEHQYPIRGNGRSCCAGPLSCVHSFTGSPHHCDSANYKWRPLMVCQSQNPRACDTFPILHVFNIHSIRGNATPAYNESHLNNDCE